LRLLLLSARPRTRNDRLPCADLAVLEGVGGLTELSGKPPVNGSS
jgi:hypothetical protein